MQLTTEQINRLYEFTRQHYVEWYDLQTELVDHLANAIEKQWLENPKIPFEDVLQLEFKKFGVFGFMDVVEKRQASLSKKYNMIIWKHFKDFFKLPQIIGTFLATYILSKILSILFFDAIFPIIFLTGILISIFFFSFTKRKINQQKKEDKKRWLFEEIIYSYGHFSGLLFIPLQIVNGANIFNETIIEKPILLLLVSFIIVSYYLIMYVIIKIIPSKAEVYLKETYPEYELVD
ncbi:hypothetical protein SY27_10000 [Flavobacterium sp. 316]|uniref:Uncharacterized protein n=1 Tax=Flavobacterium sediminilitoris TaxID=2024526 RepID=A0ABY4HR50_9FLAO|nr:MULTISPECIES: hypothetical protein [Flavobacterium]KIX21093.1 hypothetical protein SY27_10000 [Flavobacterium sp. 316]UOX35178.1 hypothetical protein LXD69_06590 [Flavobacterium sediminilitoris]